MIRIVSQATRHCEIEAIDAFLGIDWLPPYTPEEFSNSPCPIDVPEVSSAKLDLLRESDLFVTCEPCVMCAAALRIIGNNLFLDLQCPKCHKQPIS